MSYECPLNAGGCVDLLTQKVAAEASQGGSGSCGDVVTNEVACERYACGPTATCSPTDTCTSVADENLCASYASASTTCSAAFGAAVSACFPKSEADFEAFVDVFCGQGP
jgi:hypothetical protein